MPKYRQKPIEVDAFQMIKERRISNQEWPEWLHEAWNKDHLEPGAVYPSEFPNSDGVDQLLIRTTEGSRLVNWGDYIVKGGDGTILSWKPHVFEAIYELVSI